MDKNSLPVLLISAGMLLGKFLKEQILNFNMERLPKSRWSTTSNIGCKYDQPSKKLALQAVDSNERQPALIYALSSVNSGNKPLQEYFEELLRDWLDSTSIEFALMKKFILVFQGEMSSISTSCRSICSD